MLRGSLLCIPFNLIKDGLFCIVEISKIILSGQIPRIPKTFGEVDNYPIWECFERSYTDDFHKSEVSSAGVIANARGCAKLASIMADKVDTV